MKRCTHTGPFLAVRPVCGDRVASAAAVCVPCGAFRYPGRDDWGGEKVKASDVFLEDVALEVLSTKVATLEEAFGHAVAADRAVARFNRNGVWFYLRGEIPPWLESKIDPASGDLLVRERG